MELLWMCLLVEVIAMLSAARGPPRLSEKVSHRQSARLGHTAKLPCPVEGDPPPIMMWSKEGRNVHRGWTRFRVLQHGLRVKEVETDDAGTYVCKATNGFGSVSVNFTLIVIDDSGLRNGGGEPGGDGESIHQPDLAGKMVRPRFTEPAKMRRRVIERPLGSSVRLKCAASGSPAPEIVWLKDGRPLGEEGGEAGAEEKTRKKKKRWTLSLKNLAPEHSGKYTCHVSSSAGEINATYRLEVIQRTISKPVLTGTHPVNTTVDYGGTTSFQCKVRSDVKPVIQWLKRVEPGDEGKFNATIEVGDNRYVVLPTGDVWSRPDGSYLNKLLISRAKMEDGGVYICLGANTKGYSFRSAVLTVLPDPKSPQSPVPVVTAPSLPWPVIIGIPAGVAFILGTALLWFYQSKRTCSSSSSSLRAQRLPAAGRDRTCPASTAGAEKDSLSYEEYVAHQQLLAQAGNPKIHPKICTDVHTHTHSHVNGKVHQHQHIHYQC